MNIANTVGINGVEDTTVGSIKLGTGGGTISGYNGSIGIGTTAPGYLLDVNGTAHFAGQVNLPSAAGSTYIASGTGDGASYATYDVALKGWWGLALRSYDDSVHGLYDFRTGNLTTDGVATFKGGGANTFTGPVTAPTFSGALSGNATTATTATQAYYAP